MKAMGHDRQHGPDDHVSYEIIIKRWVHSQLESQVRNVSTWLWILSWWRRRSHTPSLIWWSLTITRYFSWRYIYRLETMYYNTVTCQVLIHGNELCTAFSVIPWPHSNQLGQGE